MPEPTPRQIALAVAALQHGAWVEYDEARDEWCYNHPHNTMTSWGKTPMLALATVAETERWEPDPWVWGNHLRLRVIEAARAVEEHRLDCLNDCGLRHDKCATAAELGEQFRAADEALHEFQERRAKANG